MHANLQRKRDSLIQSHIAIESPSATREMIDRADELAGLQAKSKPAQKGNKKRFYSALPVWRTSDIRHSSSTSPLAEFDD